MLAWAFFERNAWRLKFGGMGTCTGVETGPALEQLIAAGVDRGLAEDLLANCERGFLAALRENDDIDGH